MCQTERVRRFDTTKETLDKRVSKSGIQTLHLIQTQEGSPFREAAPSRSESTAGTRASHRDLVATARLLFPARQKLYGVDGFGRRSEIETGHMSADAYQALLEACQNPIRFDGPPQTFEPVVADMPVEAPEGCKLGPETGLPLLEWWELPGTVATWEETQVMINRNLERVGREGRGGCRLFPGGAR